MIVEPDFPDHFKTKELVNITRDKNAGMYLVRLWCHCHARKACRFSHMPAQKLAAICQWEGDPEKFMEALLKTGFLERGEDRSLYVHDWDHINAQLVANWTNGGKGGRPKTSEAKPTGNPPVTQSEPIVNPSVTDRLNGRKGGNRKKGEKGAKRKTEKIVVRNHDFSQKVPKGIEPVILFGASLQLSEFESRKFFDYNKRRDWGKLTDGTYPKRRPGWRRLMELWKERFEERKLASPRSKNPSMYDLPPGFDPNKPNAHTGGLAFAN